MTVAPELSHCTADRLCGRHRSLTTLRGPCSASYAPGTSLAIFADRGNHKVIAKTDPEDADPPIVAKVAYTKWDDGAVTSAYVYPDGKEQVLLVTDAAWFEREFKPRWNPVTG